MNDFIHEVENIAEQYGLQITGLDVIDVTLMVRIPFGNNMCNCFLKDFKYTR